MRSAFHYFSALFATGLATLALPVSSFAMEPGSGLVVTSPAAISIEELPDAPQPLAVAAAELFEPQAPTGYGPADESSSNSQQTDSDRRQRQDAKESMKDQEQQRLLEIFPVFSDSYRSDAVSLTASEKIRLAIRSATAPVTFAGALLAAGYRETRDDDNEFGWGVRGYGRRSGAAYLDSVNSTMIGNGFLPALFHQDPRYFRLGHGAVRHRVLHAVAASFICKHDDTGKLELNYSNMLGDIAAGGLSNIYYPSRDRGIGLTIGNGLIVTARGGAGFLFREFWPDVSRKLLRKDRTRGPDPRVRQRENWLEP